MKDQTGSFNPPTPPFTNPFDEDLAYEEEEEE